MKKKTSILLIILCSLLTSRLTAQNDLPSREKRIYELSLIWKEMNYNFVFPEMFQKINLDSLYLEYLPKVEQVSNSYEYFRVLSEFMAHFNEGHTRIFTDKRPDDTPPLDVINFGEKIIISNIARGMSDKIPIGSEILKINDISAVEFIKDSVYPYISAGNPHWKFDKSVSEMFYGAPQSAVKITVKTPQGLENEIKMVYGDKEEMVDTTSFSPIKIKILNDSVGYIHLASCQSNYRRTIDSVFISWIPQLKNCKGLIVDVRGNRGGSTQTWLMMAACLNDSVNNHGTHFSRKHVPTYKMWGRTYEPYNDYYLGTAMEEIRNSPITTNIPDNMKLRQPLIILSNSFVGSATEWFLALMKEEGRATIIGSPSAGCLTEPMVIPLSGDLSAFIAVKKYVNPDGSQSNTTGILPDIEIQRNHKEYLKGKDNVLERAIEELRKLIE